MDTHNHATLKLTPSNTRTAVLFAAMIIWFLLGATRYAMVGGILMFALAAVGLVGALVYGLMLLPGSSYLEATPERLTISSAFRKRTYTWPEIESFYVDTIMAREVVKYRLGPGTNESHAREETLPDTYGLPAQELADELDAFRRRAKMAPS
jgi:hypothetical protein